MSVRKRGLITSERGLAWSARLEIENNNDDEYENDSQDSTAGRPRLPTDNS